MKISYLIKAAKLFDQLMSNKVLVTSLTYTVSHKNAQLLFLTVTLVFLGRLLRFLYQ